MTIVWHDPIVVIDLETTGFSGERDTIIQVAAVRFKDGKIVDRWESYVDPGDVPVPLQIQKLTGITTEILSGQPSLYDTLVHLSQWVGNDDLLAHNASFEQMMLSAALKKCNLPPFKNTMYDTLPLSRVVQPTASHRLGNLCATFGVELTAAHNAAHDAEATGRLFYKLLERLVEFHPETLSLVHALAAGDSNLQRLVARARDQSLQSSFSRPPIYPVLALKQRQPEGDEDDVSPITPGITDENSPNTGEARLEEKQLDVYSVADYFTVDGSIGRHMAQFELRPQQVQFSLECERAFAEQQFLIAEAGTGTGKSLGYLLPALLQAFRNNERITVSTHTIALQEQILHKEVPFLREVLPFPFRVKLVKGRNHYICLRRWDELIRDEDPASWDADRRDLYIRIPTWLAMTQSGDRAELNLNRVHDAAWNDIAAERDACSGDLCPFSGRCFVVKAKKEAEQANLLIVNHALLLSDFRSGSRVLPEYAYLIVDEAHHIPDVASEHLGVRLTDSFWSRIHNRFLLSKKYWQPLLPSNMADKLEEAWSRANAQAELFWKLLEQWGQDKLRSVQGTGGNSELRLPTHYDPNIDEIDEQFLHLWSTTKENWLLGLQQAKEQTLLTAAKLETDHKQQAERLRLFAQNLDEIVQQVTSIDLADESAVTWLESFRYGTRGRQHVRYCVRTAPLHVGDHLKDHWEPLQAAVFTSATLSVADNFRYMKQLLGLNHHAERLIERHFSSPFSYRDQALLCLPADFIEPSGLDTVEYERQVAEFLQRLAPITSGRTLVLFTSHQMLRNVYLKIKDSLEQNGLLVLGQNIDGSRTALLETFRNEPRSFLLGSNTFWEGIDLPGELLRCVVIVRLPFSPPSHPLYQARLEAVKQDGGNPFRTISLPEAVLRFKQGFGRLIRTSDDQGVVIVLDPRLGRDRGYGKLFLHSLPGPAIVRGSSGEILQHVDVWLHASKARYDQAGVDI